MRTAPLPVPPERLWATTWEEEHNPPHFSPNSSLATAAAPSADSPETHDLTKLAKDLAALRNEFDQRTAADKKKEAAARKIFEVRPFGRVHLDAGAFNQSAANIATVGNARNGVGIRRFRLGAEGEGFDTFFYRMDIDVVTFDQQTATRPVIVDAYLDTMNLPVLGNIRAGQFREPMSLDRLDSTHDLPFMERTAVVNTLVPFRNVGIMAFNVNQAETMTWATGIFDENTNEFGEANRDRAGIASTSRITWLPYYDELAEGRYLLHFGAGYSYRRISNQSRRFGQTPEFILKEGVVSRTPNFVDTGFLNLPDYHVFNVEACAVWGSFSLQGEYIGLVGHEVGQGNLFFQGGYIEGMYWLTGENRNYNRKTATFGPVTPHSNFFRVRTGKGIETGSGAWEVAARLSNLDLNSLDIAGGNMTNVTLGLNWYYAVRCRVMFNYIHSFLDRGGVSSDADIFATRFQFAF